MKTALVFAAALFLTLPPLTGAEPVMKADFSTEALPEGWKGIKGEWKVVDGALMGAARSRGLPPKSPAAMSP